MLLKLQIQRVSNFPSTLGEAVLHCELRAPLQHMGWKLLLTELKAKMQNFSFLFHIVPFACLHLPGRPDSYVQIFAQDGQRARGALQACSNPTIHPFPLRLETAHVQHEPGVSISTFNTTDTKGIKAEFSDKDYLQNSSTL